VRLPDKAEMGTIPGGGGVDRPPADTGDSSVASAEGQTMVGRGDTRANSTDSGLSSAACDKESLMDLSQSLQNLLASMEREQELTTQAAMSVSDQVSKRNSGIKF
jgi:hypothetical protein